VEESKKRGENFFIIKPFTQTLKDTQGYPHNYDRTGSRIVLVTLELRQRLPRPLSLSLPNNGFNPSLEIRLVISANPNETIP